MPAKGVFDMTRDQIQKVRADKEFAAIRGFYIHFLIYAAVIVLLVAINAFSGGTMWAHWPALGWGIGILAHGYGAFFKVPKEMAAWEAVEVSRLTPAA